MRKRDSKQLWTTILLYLPIFALSKGTAFFKKTANLLKKLLPNLPGTQKINLDFEKKKLQLPPGLLSSLTTVVSSEISEKIKAIKAKLILLAKKEG